MVWPLDLKDMTFLDKKSQVSRDAEVPNELKWLCEKIATVKTQPSNQNVLEVELSFVPSNAHLPFTVPLLQNGLHKLCDPSKG